MEINIEIDDLAATPGLDKNELLQSADLQTREFYNGFLRHIHGALSYNADNDTATKFRIAKACLPMEQAQAESFDKLADAITKLGEDKDPPRMQFEILMTPDEEICIARKSSVGLNNILIFQDGTMAHSFIAYKNSGKQDFLHFLEADNSKEFENLLIYFFEYR